MQYLNQTNPADDAFEAEKKMSLDDLNNLAPAVCYQTHIKVSDHFVVQHFLYPMTFQSKCSGFLILDR